MKPVLLVTCLLFSAFVVRADDLQLSAERKRTSLGGTQSTGKATKKTEENWQYVVKVSNNSFNAKPALKAYYMIFVQRQELATKMGEGSIESVKGTTTLQALNSHGKGEFSTSEVTLREQSLAAGFGFTNGANFVPGQTKAKDIILGIWVKLFDGTNEVAQYVNPPTLPTKHNWEQ